jgi:hypothetical protein
MPDKTIILRRFVMSVELWYGEKPTNYAEQSVLVDMYNYLQVRPEHYLLMVSFHAGLSGEMDLMIIKRDGLLLVELKHYWSKITGRRSGSWTFTKDSGGERKMGNPFQQVQKARHKWMDWCKANASKLPLRETSEDALELLNPFEYVVFFPDLHPDSDIDVGTRPVQVMGLPKFRTELLIRSMDGLNLSREERQWFPQLLGLKRWHIESPERHDPTVKLDDDYTVPKVQMLVVRGHEFSRPALHLDSNAVVVGRDWSCGLVIKAPSVSRQHAIIRYQDGRWVVEDLGSDNGTYVSYNGDPQFERRVDKVNALKNGSIIRFGEASYTLLLSE